MRAVAKPYDICWETGEDKILLVSVGTGTAPHRMSNIKAEEYNLMKAVTSVPATLIQSTVIEQDTLCRIFGKCLNGHQIDQEIGDLIGLEPPGGQHLFTYVRYNDELSTDSLARFGLAHIKAEDIQRIDSTRHVEDLVQVGRKIAEQVQRDHLYL